MLNYKKIIIKNIYIVDISILFYILIFMYNEDSKYYNFLLNSLFYDKDDIVSFFGLESNIGKNISDIKNILNYESNEILESVSKILYSIISNKNNFEIDASDNNKALKSIFTTFKKHKSDYKKLKNIKYYPLSILDNEKEDKIIYPDNTKDSFQIDYKENFNENANKINLKEILNTKNINGILNALSNLFSYVPYSKGTECGIGDISFYDKLKINTALSSCLYLLKDRDNSYNAEDSNKNHFVLLSGDISGIQKFIYTISSKGALKSLRARSFYLEIMLEHIADEILEYFHLTRANLLYTGGGHFYIILPNFEDINEKISNIMQKLNDWFIYNFSIDLYIAMGIEEFNFKDLEDFASVFKKLSKKLTQIKQRRYFYDDNNTQLENLLMPKDNQAEYECSICHTSSKTTKKTDFFSADNEDKVYACDICINLCKLGKCMLSKEKSIFIIKDKSLIDKNYADEAVDLPSLDYDKKNEKSNRYFYFADVKDIKNTKDTNLVRAYSKNNNDYNYTNLFLGEYNFKENENDRNLIDFETLVKGTEDNPTIGINRLAVLRCDVDSLGDAFMNGFKGHADILRTSSFSRHLSLFFKYYINCVCECNTNISDYKPFGNLYSNEKKYEKRIVIVYSGGDDVFLVGHWLDVINFTLDLREAFKKYTNDELTFSAGIGFFHNKYPISKMASQTGELEDLAKKNENGKKDSVALFGIPQEDESKYVFSWNEFEKVKEKIDFLFSVGYFSKDAKEKDIKEKIFLSASMIYRLKQLIEFYNKDEGMNIPRLAYSLARINYNNTNKENYNKFKDTIYNWFTYESKVCKDKKDEDTKNGKSINKEIKYLNIALDLIIYLFRKE